MIRRADVATRRSGFILPSSGWVIPLCGGPRQRDSANAALASPVYSLRAKLGTPYTDALVSLLSSTEIYSTLV